jgi:hypothetical protein
VTLSVRKARADSDPAKLGSIQNAAATDTEDFRSDEALKHYHARFPARTDRRQWTWPTPSSESGAAVVGSANNSGKSFQLNRKHCRSPTSFA